MRADRGTERVPLLVGHFGARNAGDEAMLEGTRTLLAATGIRSARVVTRRRGYEPPQDGGCALEVVTASPVAVLRAVLTSSVVVLCGGTHFHDDYAPARRLRHYRYLARYVLVAAWARCRGRRVVAIGQGFGPLDHPTGRLLTRALLRLVSNGTTRDTASLAAAVRLRARPSRWSATADTAAALCAPEAATRTPRDALLVAPVHGERAAGLDRGLAPLWAALPHAVAAAWPSLGLDRIEVVALRGGERESDRAVTGRLAVELGAIAPCGSAVFDDDLAALLGRFSTARIALCARYHALLFAILRGAVPVVLPYHRKLLDTAADVGLPESLIVREARADAVTGALAAAAAFDPEVLAATLERMRASLSQDAAVLAGRVAEVVS